MSIAKKVREYKEANPNATVKEIAKACGTSSPYVYQILKPKAKKLPKAYPLKKKEKDPADGKKIVRNEILRLNDRLSDVLFTNETQAELLDMYSEKIEQLEMDVVGYRAVISYLQGQLDGLAV